MGVGREIAREHNPVQFHLARDFTDSGPVFGPDANGRRLALCLEFIEGAISILHILQALGTVLSISRG